MYTTKTSGGRFLVLEGSGEIHMQKWVVAAKRADFGAIAEKFGIDQVTARLIRNRDVVGDAAIEEYLNGSLLNLHSAHQMKDCDKAAALLADKIDAQKKIRIIGDYDIDGVCATCILYRALQLCGANVDYDLPDRILDGYGLNRNLIDLAGDEGVDTILTCDNGIAAVEEVAYARSLGMTVIVTDHHEPGEVLPEADALVNPHQKSCPYPYKNLCGAAVAYKLVTVLCEAMGIPQDESEKLIELAGFATVGDVMDLTGENRILVKEGLLQLNHTENPGLQALIRVNNLQDKEITSYHIGFVLGPCLNAGGRLDTAKKSLELLLAQSEAEATLLAEELLELNERRKAMTLEGYEQAVELIENGPMRDDKVLVVYLPDCHESLAGIIAGRLRERYYRPAIVLTQGESAVKGSGRSIESYSMFQELQKCADLFLKFGGHPMAAGCSLEKENVGELRRRLNAQTTLTQEDLTEKIVIDVPMPLGYITERLIEELSCLEPFGKGNSKPVFAEKNLDILSARAVGQSGRVVRLRVANAAGTVMDAVYFGDATLFREYVEEKYGRTETEKLFQGRRNAVQLSVIYYPSIHEYNGLRSIQIVVQKYQ
ncbi:single-stranded-DNA-specific exonuclease RecJ [Marvinbryantia formatexigens DSM 14469]|uniref:Single-stranded-DNA-specific exonuclease RecJ n=2 Tax=Marvinbryantia TaxID=248744 RepID=C6LAA7_9FIRM|nr:single-stranded-DNA-specific exonuclease RecJ [Marvinbryantia formatexigens DSM 14469]